MSIKALKALKAKVKQKALTLRRPLLRVVASQRMRARMMKKATVMSLKSLGAQSPKSLVREAGRTGVQRDEVGKDVPLASHFGAKQEWIGQGRGKPKVLDRGNYKRFRVARSLGASIRHEAQRYVRNSNAPEIVKMAAKLPKDVQTSYWRSGKRLVGAGRFKGKSQRVQESTRRVVLRQGAGPRDWARVLMHPITAGRTRIGKRKRRA